MSQQLIVAPTAAKAKAAQDDHKFGSVVPLSEPYWSVKGGRVAERSAAVANGVPPGLFCGSAR